MREKKILRKFVDRFTYEHFDKLLVITFLISLIYSLIYFLFLKDLCFEKLYQGGKYVCNFLQFLNVLLSALIASIIFYFFTTKLPLERRRKLFAPYAVTIIDNIINTFCDTIIYEIREGKESSNKFLTPEEINKYLKDRTKLTKKWKPLLISNYDKVNNNIGMILLDLRLTFPTWADILYTLQQNEFLSPVTYAKWGKVNETDEFYLFQHFWTADSLRIYNDSLKILDNLIKREPFYDKLKNDKSYIANRKMIKLFQQLNREKS